MKFIILQMFNNVTEGPGVSSTSTYTAEIVIMLLGAFVFGYLLRYFMVSSKPKDEIAQPVQVSPAPKETNTAYISNNNNAELSKLKSTLAEANAEINLLRAKPDNSPTIDIQSREINLKTTEIVSLKSEISRLKSELEVCQVSNNALMVAKAKKDELKKLEGIGPKIQELLYEAGIFTFQELSQTSTERIKEILIGAGERYRIHDPSSWPQQAELAANNRWDELKKLQDELNGGKL